MSILVALLAGRHATQPGEPQPADPRPVVDDPIVMAMRPDSRAIATLHVGPTREHATLTSAVAAAKQIQAARKTAEGAPFLTPDYRVDIIMDPGHYDEPGPITPIGPFIGVYAADVQKGTTSINREIVPHQFVYWEGVDIHTGAYMVDGKYCIHASNQRGTLVFARMSLTKVDPANPDTQLVTYGHDGGDWGFTVLYDATMTGGTNAHGWDFDVHPQTFCMIDVHGKGNAAWGGRNTPDHFWLIDSSCDVVDTKALGGVHINGTDVRSGTISLNGSPLDDRRDWPIPYGGLSPWARAHYGLDYPTPPVDPRT
ncbi:hypothetical protein ACTND8_06185 [Atopobiaceae bacterium HCP3S3_F7]